MNAPDLHCHCSYSFWDGWGLPKDVVARGKELGWGAVCLTEHGWMGSAPVLYQEAKKEKLKPIIGIEAYVVPDRFLVRDKIADGETRHLTVLALSFEGYQNLVAWCNYSMRPEDAFYYKPRISIEKMIETAPWPLHHNVILSGCMGGELCQAILNANSNAWYAAVSYVEAMRSVFPNFYLEVQNHYSPKFANLGLANYDTMLANQSAARDLLLALAQETETPIVVSNDSHYQSKAQRKAHIAMLARKDHRQPREAHRGQAIEQIAEQYAANYVYWMSYMREMEPIAATLPAWAEKEAIENLHAIVDEVDIRLDPLDEFSYSVPRSRYEDPIEEIRRRCKPRLKSLIARHGQVAKDRFEKEIGVMGDFAHYLLLWSDLVQEARAQGIYSWTRGSSANSMLCYCLKIHEIDSIHYKLIFERFVNPARKKWPDIDVDFEGHRQGDVAKILKEMLAETEGEDNVRAICTYNTVANRAAFRLMAQAAGVDKEKIDELANLLPQMIDSGMVSNEEDAYELLKEEAPELYDLAASVFDAVAGVSQHACAFALGTEERPITAWVPDYYIASSGARVTQFNMDAIERLGLLKMDLLKLDSLTILHNVARMLGKDMKWLDGLMQSEPGIYGAEDEQTYKMLNQGRTEGIHTFQGKTQRRGVMEVHVENDFDAIAVQALYRPSSTRTHFDKMFVNRRHEREDWKHLNSLTEQFLDETYGIAIYQEQIMEMAFEMGMSGEEVDDLYKAIKTAKGIGRGARELFEAFEPTFRKYARNLMPTAEADELWSQWQALQGYTFNRGHASSYGILALKGAFVKAHYPREWFIALLEKYPDNPRFTAGALAEGFKFEPPDINRSGGGFSAGSARNSIRIGLRRVRGIGPGAVGQITKYQPFSSVEDLIDRCDNRSVDKTVVANLRRVGAFEAAFGIRGEEDDLTDYELLSFVTRRPRAMEGCDPKLPPRNKSSSWKFLGLTKDVRPTEGKTFVAKLFWIPPSKDIFKTKTSTTGQYNAHLLTVVDVNGIPFDLIVAESKEAESKLVKFLASKCQGCVITAEGQITMPFLRNGNPGFRLWGITGTEYSHPQMWHCEKVMKQAVVEIMREKEYKPKGRRAA